MVFGTAFGKVNAQIEFLYTGADGVALPQAFAFLAMGSREQPTLQSSYRTDAG